MIYLENFVDKSACVKLLGEMFTRKELASTNIDNQFSPRVFSQDENIYFSNILFSEQAVGVLKTLIHSMENIYGVKTTQEFSDKIPTFSFYEHGGFLGPHSDVYGKDAEPCLSFVIYINDSYEGGNLLLYENQVNETSFNRESKDTGYLIRPNLVSKIRPPAGSVIAFSPNLFHEAEPVTLGEKYISTIVLPCRELI